MILEALTCVAVVRDCCITPRHIYTFVSFFFCLFVFVLLRCFEIKVMLHVLFLLPCRPKSWIEEQEMGSFLSVAKGSDEPPVFLEIHYRGSPKASDPPVVFVGKGITFDRYCWGFL